MFAGAFERIRSQVLQLQPIFSPLVLAKVRECLAPFQTPVVFFHRCCTACSVQRFIDWKESREREEKFSSPILQEQEMRECQGLCRVVALNFGQVGGAGLPETEELLNNNP